MHMLGQKRNPTVLALPASEQYVDYVPGPVSISEAD